MKPHPRIRKTVKWGGLAAGVALAAVWALSGWWALHWHSGGDFVFGIGRGRVEITWDGLLFGVPRGWSVLDLSRPPCFVWAFLYRAVGPDLCIVVPLWCPFALAMLSAAAAWSFDARAQRRERAHSCPACGYDRRGLGVDAVCPECGAAAARLIR